MRTAVVVGARPNFMKAAPLLRQLQARPNIEVLVVHSGQHYDPTLSDVFFSELEIPRPHVHLEVGSASHAAQTAQTMLKLEPVLLDFRPDVVIVVGDVNSTLAGSLAAAKLGIAVAHVEAGLRSFDRSMPEEINRVVTDAVADFLFVTEPDGLVNLKREGRPEERIFYVGNVMIDTLLANLVTIDGRDVLTRLNLQVQQYAVVTLHRPSNVDTPESLSRVISILAEMQRFLTVVFPIHPRTRRKLKEFSLEPQVATFGRLVLTEPLGYLDFVKLVKESRLVVTDSGGIQEESTVLGVPCLTMRTNTERPITVTLGTNQLVGNDPVRVLDAFHRLLSPQQGKQCKVPDLWDGHAADRIVEILCQQFQATPSLAVQSPGRDKTDLRQVCHEPVAEPSKRPPD